MIAPLVSLEAMGIRIVGDIQPMPSPSLAVLRRSEHSIDQSLPRIGGSIGNEVIHLFRSWRDAEQIKTQASDQRLARSPRERLNVVLGHFHS